VRAEIPDGLEVFTMPDAEGSKKGAAELLSQQFIRYRAVRTAFRQIQRQSPPDLVYVVTLDHYEKMISLLGSPFAGRPFAGMVLDPKFHRKVMGVGPPTRNDTLYRWLFRRLLRTQGLVCTTVVDESFFEYTRSNQATLYEKLSLVPDVGELVVEHSRADARAEIGLAPHQFVILVYGSITARKGLAELLAAVDGSAESTIALIAGAQDAESEALLREAPAMRLRAAGRLIESNGFLTAELEARAFAAADAVWLGYAPGFYGSSGVLFQAAAAGLPVLASSTGLIGWLTRRHQLGLTFDTQNVHAVRSAIRDLMHDHAARTRFTANGRAVGRQHTGTIFGDAVCDAITAGNRGVEAQVA
jgi:glycosyltransferase involved in cell wall biosynthesis